MCHLQIARFFDLLYRILVVESAIKVVCLEEQLPETVWRDLVAFLGCITLTSDVQNGPCWP